MGGSAGAAAAATTTPLDVVKTRMMCSASQRPTFVKVRPPRPVLCGAPRARPARARTQLAWHARVCMHGCPGSHADMCFRAHTPKRACVHALHSGPPLCLQQDRMSCCAQGGACAWACVGARACLPKSHLVACLRPLQAAH